jgi:uncharacterized protein YqkB
VISILVTEFGSCHGFGLVHGKVVLASDFRLGPIGMNTWTNIYLEEKIGKKYFNLSKTFILQM